ncbi:MAG: hypothetical protein ACYDEF_05980 [Methanosarcina sp.]
METTRAGACTIGVLNTMTPTAIDYRHPVTHNICLLNIVRR